MSLCLQKHESSQIVGDAHAQNLAALGLRALAVDLVAEDGLEAVVPRLGVVPAVRFGREALGVESRGQHVLLPVLLARVRVVGEAGVADLDLRLDAMLPRALPLRPGVQATVGPPVPRPDLSGLMLVPPTVEGTILVSMTLLAVLALAAGPAGRLALGLFTRIHPGQALGNPLRARIHAIIASDPGATASELQERLDCGWGTVMHHVAVLERHGLVRGLRDGRHRRLFAGPASPPLQEAMLRNDRTRKAMEFVRDHPGMRLADIARALGVGSPAALWHLRRLQRCGLAVQLRDTHVGWFPAPATPAR